MAVVEYSMPYFRRKFTPQLYPNIFVFSHVFDFIHIATSTTRKEYLVPTYRMIMFLLHANLTKSPAYFIGSMIHV